MKLRARKVETRTQTQVEHSASKWSNWRREGGHTDLRRVSDESTYICIYIYILVTSSARWGSRRRGRAQLITAQLVEAQQDNDLSGSCLTVVYLISKLWQSSNCIPTYTRQFLSASLSHKAQLIRERGVEVLSMWWDEEGGRTTTQSFDTVHNSGRSHANTRTQIIAQVLSCFRSFRTKAKQGDH